MENYTLDKFKKLTFLKELRSKIDSVLVDGKLTDEGVEKLYKDRQNLFWMYGISYQDMSNVDMSALSKDAINKISFSSSTVFPSKDKLPKFYNPQEIIKKKLDFKLHPKLDDKHITMAIIDNPTQFNLHEEFKNLNYELINYSNPDDETHFHMDGVLNNIAGSTNGYGKDAKYLLYIVDWSSHISRTESHLKALENVYNRIKNGEKIQVVSISNMLIHRDLQGTELESKIFKVVEKLKNNPYCKCEVIDSKVFSQLVPLNCSIMSNSNNVDNYELPFWAEKHKAGIIINNIRPEFGSADGYVVETECGASWAIPQLAYLYAVSRKYKNYSIEEFIDICYNSTILNKQNVNVVDVNKLMKNIKVNVM